MSRLREILEVKAAEVAELRGRRFGDGPKRRELPLRREPGAPLRLISEIKLRSPSAGPLSRVLSVTERARAYERAGASMLSVLCDTRFFDGSYEHLAAAREATSLPVLCKEFVIDEVQLDVARSFGADAVLLIVRCVPCHRVGPLVQAARDRGLEPFVEICDDTEARLALDSGATLIGVNARDLDTLQMDATRAQRTLANLPSDVVSVHLSGLHTPAAVQEVAAGPAHAALIGEVLMREDDPEPLLRSLAAAAVPA